MLTVMLNHERKQEERHPVFELTPLETWCIIYTGREKQHLSVVCQEAADSLVNRQMLGDT